MVKVVSLLIGKANSTGMPGKNWMPVNGRPACEYGFLAGKSDKRINYFYVSTDSDNIAQIGKANGYSLIERPSRLATPEALTEDALVHAHEAIKDDIGNYDLMVLLFANNPAINKKLISEGLDKLEKNSAADSVFSVCQYNMFSPIRARKIVNGKIESFVDLDIFGDEISSIRSSQGDVYFCDLSVQIIRSRVFDNIEEGSLPFKWQGKESLPVYNNYGFDIDEDWQKVVVENWLKNHWNDK